MNNSNISKVYCVIVLAICIAGLAGVTLPATIAIIILVVAVSVMGLPHGALDFAIAQMLGYCSSPLKLFSFISVYSAIVGVSVLFWLWLPAYALVIFLVISAHHFSSDWEPLLPYRVRLSLVVFTLSGPSILYAETLQHIFLVLMLSAEASQLIIYGMQVLTLFSISIFIMALLSARDKIKWSSDWEVIEIALLLVSSIAFTPLLHFTLYFCLLHSTKHLLCTAQQLHLTLLRALWISLPFVAITIFGVIVLAQFKSTNIILSDMLQYVFIGLFGLTVAHMLLTEASRKSKTVVKN